jgi:hypothetical protein
MISRRFVLRGLIAAPTVVAISSLMPIRGLRFQYFPWGVVADGHVVKLYDQIGNADMVASMGGFAPTVIGSPISVGLGGCIENGQKLLHYWGTQLLTRP